MPFKARKHCKKPSCDSHVVEWDQATDEDGTPVLGLFWLDQNSSVPMVFQKLEDAERIAAFMNSAVQGDQKN